MSSSNGSTSTLLMTDLAVDSTATVPLANASAIGSESVRLKGFAAGTASGLTKLIVGRESSSPIR